MQKDEKQRKQFSVLASERHTVVSVTFHPEVVQGAEEGRMALRKEGRWVDVSDTV